MLISSMFDVVQSAAWAWMERVDKINMTEKKRVLCKWRKTGLLVYPVHPLGFDFVCSDHDSHLTISSGVKSVAVFIISEKKMPSAVDKNCVCRTYGTGKGERSIWTTFWWRQLRLTISGIRALPVKAWGQNVEKRDFRHAEYSVM